MFTIICLKQLRCIKIKKKKICRQQQNRSQKIFNRETLRLCRGLDIVKFDKNSTDL